MVNTFERVAVYIYMPIYVNNKHEVTNMKLCNILKGVKVLGFKGNLDVEIEGIAYDSRSIRQNYLFVCISGSVKDGHDYIDEAVSRGAVALLVEKDVEREGVAIVQVEQSRKVLPIIASKYYNYPTDTLKLIGITGTNGKTTTTYMVKSILESWNKKVGLIGTISIEIGNKKIQSTRTTPESLDLQRIFREMLDEGADYGVMEVSSHSLEFGRVDGCKFHTGVFTNLTQDHLDFHKTIENYRKAKEKLFYMTKHANIINIDDKEGRTIASNIINKGIPLLTYGINEKADIMAKEIKISDEGVVFELITPDFNTKIKSSIPGRFSVYNCLAAASIAYVEGIDGKTISEGIEKILYVPGRSEVMNIDKPYKIIIDYAHTPDGLENILNSIKYYVKGRIITIFGCGGDRDKTKRPKMGVIAGRLSDYCIITSDNPRTEDPYSIIKQIEEGIKDTNCSYICIESRREAIKHAMEMAKSGDIILLAGKGHETYQVRKDKTIDFDERVIVKELLEEGV